MKRTFLTIAAMALACALAASPGMAQRNSKIKDHRTEAGKVTGDHSGKPGNSQRAGFTVSSKAKSEQGASQEQNRVGIGYHYYETHAPVAAKQPTGKNTGRSANSRMSSGSARTATNSGQKTAGGEKH